MPFECVCVCVATLSPNCQLEKLAGLWPAEDEGGGIWQCLGGFQRVSFEEADGGEVSRGAASTVPFRAGIEIQGALEEGINRGV